MAKNMSEGKPFQLILQFAFPLLIGNLLQQTYNLIDAAIVGRALGTDALASVGASSSVQFLVLGFCIGICCGFAIPIAQEFGARNYESMREYVFQSMLLTAVAAVMITSVCAVFCPQILRLLSTPDEIYQGAYRYLLIIFLGIPFTLLYNLLASILRAMGDSRTPFFFLAISTMLNIVLDLFCVLTLKWGVAGAAAATITAQAVSGILCLILIQKKMEVLHLSRQNCKISGEQVKRLLMMAIPMGLQYSITAIGSMVMQSANNGLGSVYVSGFTAGMRIKQFVMCPFDAIATGVSVFCGQNYGAGRADRIRQGIREGVCMGAFYGLLAGVILILGGRTLSLLFISSDAKNAAEVLDASARYLRWIGCFFWSLGILNVCRMSTQGLGFSGRVVFSGVAEMAARIFVSVVFVKNYGFTAICCADQAAWLAACCYIVPTCLLCVQKISKRLGQANTEAQANRL